MTYVLMALVRAAMALPDAPKVPTGLNRYQGGYVGPRVVCFRGPDGMRWLDIAGEKAGGRGIADPEWVFDLTDAATGGVLVGMLGVWAQVIRSNPSIIEFNDGKRWRLVLPDGDVWCASLGEVVCRVAVERGTWGER